MDLTFEVHRARDDAPTLATLSAPPTIKKTGTTTATLSTNAVGSFHVFAFVDANGDNKWSPNEFGFCLPLGLVRMETGTSTSIAFTNRLTATCNDFSGGTNYIYVRVIAGDLFVSSKVGIRLENFVTLTGGGSFGHRFLNRTFVGWVNNFATLTYLGTYTGGRSASRVHVSNLASASGSYQDHKVFLAGGPAPATIFLPLLDTSRTDNPNGGYQITLGSSPADGGVGNEVSLTFGAIRTITAVDSPSWNYRRFHFSVGTAELQTVTHHLDVNSFLVGWTNVYANSGPTTLTNSVGYRTFVVGANDPWTVNGSWTITTVSGKRVLVPLVAPTITLGTITIFSPAIPANSASIEVRPPTTKGTRAYDGR
jgi:hypothetical protein